MRNRQKGFLLAEALVAIMLLGLMGILLYFGIHQAQIGMKHVADFRAATRLAQSTLLAMRAGEQPSHASGEAVTVEILPDSTADSPTVWVRVRAQIDGHPSELIGAVPRTALSKSSMGAAP